MRQTTIQLLSLELRNTGATQQLVSRESLQFSDRKCESFALAANKVALKTRAAERVPGIVQQQPVNARAQLLAETQQPVRILDRLLIVLSTLQATENLVLAFEMTLS